MVDHLNGATLVCNVDEGELAHETRGHDTACYRYNLVHLCLLSIREFCVEGLKFLGLVGGIKRIGEWLVSRGTHLCDLDTQLYSDHSLSHRRCGSTLLIRTARSSSNPAAGFRPRSFFFGAESVSFFSLSTSLTTKASLEDDRSTCFTLMAASYREPVCSNEAEEKWPEASGECRSSSSVRRRRQELLSIRD